MVHEKLSSEQYDEELRAGIIEKLETDYEYLY
jgi:hypothetical protein